MEEGCLWQGPWGVKGGTHRGAGGNGAALGAGSDSESTA